MPNWYSLSLGDGMTSSMLADEVEKKFSEVFHAQGQPLDMAIFTRGESEGRLHCEVIAYFSPAAREVAQDFEAQPCQKPVRPGLTLLAGNEAAWSVLFSEGNSAY
jgi:hypothetical protein